MTNHGKAPYFVQCFLEAVAIQASKQVIVMTDATVHSIQCSSISRIQDIQEVFGEFSRRQESLSNVSGRYAKRDHFTLISNFELVTPSEAQLMSSLLHFVAL